MGGGGAGLVQEVQGAGAAAALEGTLSGLDRGLWAAGGPAGTLMGAVGLALDDVVRCRQVRISRLAAPCVFRFLFSYSFALSSQSIGMGCLSMFGIARVHTNFHRLQFQLAKMGMPGDDIQCHLQRWPHLSPQLYTLAECKDTGRLSFLRCTIGVLWCSATARRRSASSTAGGRSRWLRQRWWWAPPWRPPSPLPPAPPPAPAPKCVVTNIPPTSYFSSHPPRSHTLREKYAVKASIDRKGQQNEWVKEL